MIETTIVNILLLLVSAASVPLAILIFTHFSGSRYGNVMAFLIPFTIAEAFFALVNVIGFAPVASASAIILFTAYLSLFCFAVMSLRVFVRSDHE